MWENLASCYVMANIPLASPLYLDIPLQSSDSTVSSMFNSEQLNIATIGATVFLCISKLLSSSNFKLYLCSLDIQANSTKLTEASDLSNVPSCYNYKTLELVK